MNTIGKIRTLGIEFRATEEGFEHCIPGFELQGVVKITIQWISRGFNHWVKDSKVRNYGFRDFRTTSSIQG